MLCHASEPTIMFIVFELSCWAANWGFAFLAAKNCRLAGVLVSPANPAVGMNSTANIHSASHQLVISPLELLILSTRKLWASLLIATGMTLLSLTLIPAQIMSANCLMVNSFQQTGSCQQQILCKSTTETPMKVQSNQNQQSSVSQDFSSPEWNCLSPL